MANRHSLLSPLVTSNPTNEESQFASSPSPIMRSTPSSPALLDSRGRLRKPLPNNHHARSVSAQNLPTPQIRTPPETYRYSYFDGNTPSSIANGNSEIPLAPPHPFRGDYRSHSDSRTSSFDLNSHRSRPGTPLSGTSHSRPMTPILNLPPDHNHEHGSSSRPSTPGGTKEKEKDKDKRKSGLLHKDKKHETSSKPLTLAWVAGHPQKQPYDGTALLAGRPMSELWDDSDGNCLVYLFPHNTGKGPSFKIDSAVFASSPALTRLAFGDIYSSFAVQSGGDRRQMNMSLDARAQNLSLQEPATPPRSPRQRRAYQADSTSSPTSSTSHSSRGRFSNASDAPGETHLYLPLKLQNPGATQIRSAIGSKDGDANESEMQDLQTLIDTRNLFAFLAGQSLVATEKKGNFFHIFMTIAGQLKSYGFTNLDGSTYGEVASGSFDSYVEELGLADVRVSRERTIEGIVLGERMKSVALYNEAFTHGAGKYEDLTNLKSPKFGLMSHITDNRLIRASMDLDKRIASAQLILNDFEFPGLFTGIMASKTSTEKKDGVRFESWKEAFLGFRKNYLSTLKHRYGSWPPKAGSKKNELETSGLNRVVLKHMYKDMCAVYDLLVDRESLTTRTVDGLHPDREKEESTIRALRAVLSEYDRSSPPVKPPVPFDLPILPKVRTLRPNFGEDKKKDIQLLQRKLKPDEISQILLQSWNKDSLSDAKMKQNPFLEHFFEMERRAAHGCTFAELVDLRIGMWIFMYVILQSLPMLVVDAPGLKFTKGVEYFLCEPPRKGVPWAHNPNDPNAKGGSGSWTPTSVGMGLASAGPNGRTWYSVGGFGGEEGNVVALPSDVVEHGVEGIFRRSHCWVMAEKWTGGSGVMNDALHDREARGLVEEAARYGQPSWRQRPITGYFTPTEFTPPPTAHGYSTGNGNSALLSPDSLPNSRPSSRGGADRRNSSLSLGLEALPLPMGVTPDGSAPSGYFTPPGYYSPGSGGGTPGERPRSGNAVDAGITFDSILGGISNVNGAGAKVKKGKK